MKNRNILYYETHPLGLNVFLLFYLYVFFVLIVANLLPITPMTYFLFLAFGIIGISILLVRYTYHISITENTIMLSIAIPFRILLLSLKIKEIRAIEETTINPLIHHAYGIKKLMPFYTYIFNKGNGIKVTMHSGKIFIISSTSAHGIITRINEFRKSSANKKNTQI